MKLDNVDLAFPSTEVLAHCYSKSFLYLITFRVGGVCALSSAKVNRDDYFYFI